MSNTVVLAAYTGLAVLSLEPLVLSLMACCELCLALHV